MKKNSPLTMRVWLIMLFCMMAVALQAAAPKITLERVEPSFWWTGFKNHQLQLLVHGDQISLTKPIVNYPGVVLESVVSVESPNYLFLNLLIGDNTPTGKVPYPVCTQREGCPVVQLRAQGP